MTHPPRLGILPHAIPGSVRGKGDDGRLQRPSEGRGYDEIGDQSRFFGEVRGGGSGEGQHLAAAFAGQEGIDGMIRVIVGFQYGLGVVHDGGCCG